MFGFDQRHDRVPIESRPRTVEIKARPNHRMKLRKIIRRSRRKDLLHRIDNLPLIHTQRSLLTRGATKSNEQHNRKHSKNTSNSHRHRNLQCF